MKDLEDYQPKRYEAAVAWLIFTVVAIPVVLIVSIALRFIMAFCVSHHWLE